jgi:hypothetical protein
MCGARPLADDASRFLVKDEWRSGERYLAIPKIHPEAFTMN